MTMAKQLTLSHENLPGMLASIVEVLGNEKVNILSCLTMTSGTTGTIVYIAFLGPLGSSSQNPFSVPQKPVGVIACDVVLYQTRSGIMSLNVE